MGGRELRGLLCCHFGLPCPFLSESLLSVSLFPVCLSHLCLAHYLPITLCSPVSLLNYLSQCQLSSLFLCVATLLL